MSRANSILLFPHSPLNAYIIRISIFTPATHLLVSPDMHYGQGMMNEEIERARKRAEAASPRSESGRLYRSPLGAGFTFDGRRPLREQMNPYSRKGERQHDGIHDGGFRIVYEEAYFNMNGTMDLDGASKQWRSGSGKECVIERMKDRRKDRVRERGEPNPYRRRQGSNQGAANEVNPTSSGCVVM